MSFVDRPQELDGKPRVTVTPSTRGWKTWFTGADDDADPTPPASGRGDGAKIELTFTQPETKVLDLQFVEPIELHRGFLLQIPAADWKHDDRWSFSAYMPATTVVVNATNEGNCKLIDIGGVNKIEPADGDGTHDVDLAMAIPVPVDDWLKPVGLWHVDLTTGAITVPADPGTGNCDLFDFAIESFFLKNMPLGYSSGEVPIDTYQAEWISERWKLRISITRVTAGAGPYTIAGWLMLFRQKTT